MLFGPGGGGVLWTQKLRVPVSAAVNPENRKAGRQKGDKM